jgi:hypothetical protein
MDSRPAEVDAFMIELLKRKRNLNKHLEKIAQAEIKASQGHKLVEEQIKKLQNKARYEEQIAEIDSWIALYTKTHGVRVPDKPKPVVVVVEEPPKQPEKPDTRVPDILRLWLTGSYLAEEQVRTKLSGGSLLDEFLAFWKHIQGEELETFEDVAGRAQALLQKYLEGSEELAPQTTRSYAEIKRFVEESALWLQGVQRPEAVKPDVLEEVVVVTTPCFSEPVDTGVETLGGEENPVFEEHRPLEEETKRGWADEEEEVLHEAPKAEESSSEEDEFTTFTKKKKKQAPAPTRDHRPRGMRGNRGPRRPRGKFPAKSGPA